MIMPRRITAALAAAIAILSSPAHAVYKCVINGKTTYSQEPCADGARQIDTTPARGLPSAQAQPNSARRTIETVETLAAARRLRNLEFDIDASQRRLDSLRDSMTRELDALRAKRAHASNNLAGALWEQSIATEMQAVAARYTADLDAEQRKLDALHARRAAEKAAAQ